MAIDDNTLYGLTGAQVKELPERIEAVKGLARELTADDYNANSSNWADTDPTNFDCIAAWKLDSGLYRTPTNVRVYVANNSRIPATNSGGDACLFAVSRFVQYNVNYAEIMVLGSYYAYPYTSYYPMWRTQISDGNGSKSWEGLMVSNSLTNNSAGYVLDARQGRVLKGLIDAIAIRGAGAPTTSTVGEVGQLYEDDTNGALYQLKSIDITVTPNTYNWEQVGGSSVNVVQAIGTSTSDVMSQNAVTSMVYGDPSSKQKVQIGGNSNAGGALSVAIGYGAEASAAGVGSVALGQSAQADNGAIAIGRGTQNTVAGTVSFQDTNWGNSGYNSTGYRLLTGLYDPQSDHDAATKGYVDSVAPTITMTTTDPGEGAPLAANQFIGVYE